MLKNLLSVCYLIVLACNVLANPLARDDGDDNRKTGGCDRHRCLSQEQGDKILSTWINFFVNTVPADVAAQYLTSDFHLFSESTNNVSPGKADTVSHYLLPDSFLSVDQSINRPIKHPIKNPPAPCKSPLTPSSPSQPAKVAAPVATDIPSFIATQSFNDGSSKFTVIAKAYSCDTITFRWQIANFSPFPVGGIDFLILNKDRGNFKIKTAYSEFNTVAFLVDIGQFPTPCNSTG